MSPGGTTRTRNRGAAGLDHRGEGCRPLRFLPPISRVLRLVVPDDQVRQHPDDSAQLQRPEHPVLRRYEDELAALSQPLGGRNEGAQAHAVQEDEARQVEAHVSRTFVLRCQSIRECVGGAGVELSHERQGAVSRDDHPALLAGYGEPNLVFQSGMRYWAAGLARDTRCPFGRGRELGRHRSAGWRRRSRLAAALPSESLTGDQEFPADSRMNLLLDQVPGTSDLLNGVTP